LRCRNKSVISLKQMSTNPTKSPTSTKKCSKCKKKFNIISINYSLGNIVKQLVVLIILLLNFTNMIVLWIFFHILIVRPSMTKLVTKHCLISWIFQSLIFVVKNVRLMLWWDPWKTDAHKQWAPAQLILLLHLIHHLHKQLIYLCSHRYTHHNSLKVYIMMTDKL
jgi:hypothetical protein